MDNHPLGFEAARNDWDEKLAGRSMNDRDWTSLTFGEQARYGAQECKTKGAIYSVYVAADVIEVKVNLPRSLILSGLTKDEAEWIEFVLHRSLENAIHWIITRRQIRGQRK